jgi:hypothetical protein
MTNLEQLSLREMEELLSSSGKGTWEAKDVAAKYAIIVAVLKPKSIANSASGSAASCGGFWLRGPCSTSMLSIA